MDPMQIQDEKWILALRTYTHGMIAYNQLMGHLKREGLCLNSLDDVYCPKK